MKTLNFNKILYWGLIFLVIFLIIQLIIKIFGGSLGFEELVIGLLIANLGYSFQINSKISDINSRLAEHVGWHRGKGHFLDN